MHAFTGHAVTTAPGDSCPLNIMSLTAPHGTPHRALQQLHGGAVMQSPRANGMSNGGYGATPSHRTPSRGGDGPTPAGGFTGRNYVRPDRHALAGRTIDVNKGPHRCAALDFWILDPRDRGFPVHS